MAPAHAGAIALLHAEGIPGGFLSTLGPRFLARLYASIARDPQSAVLVALESDGRVGGFVAVTAGTRGMYRRVLLSRAPWFAFEIARRCCSPRVVRYAFQTFLYGIRRSPGESGDTSCGNPEILAIAVSSVSRGRGYGRALLDHALQFLSSRGATAPLHVVTSALDPTSNAFYSACGFSPAHRFTHHGHPMVRLVRGA